MITTYEEYLDTKQSLTLEEMQDIHSQMIAEIDTDKDSKEIYEELIATAAKYAVIRAR